ncbi:MAG TPA: lactate utilization protein [Candidatus Binataceae bacterium]|nr:lactate utilization protein [Candidatus Binataceae bacterium]
MSSIHKILASVKDALETTPGNGAHPHPMPAPMPSTPSAERAELVSSFARELEAVGGRFLGTIAPKQIGARIASYATELGARTIAYGDGVATDMKPIASALERSGCTLVKAAKVKEDQRAAARSQIFGADLGIAEADFAISLTGTLVMTSAPARPNSLTLVPPASLVIVQVDKIVPNLAALFAVMAPEAIATTRMTMVTGPSRTADIEKRIVLGIHGPKSLAVIIAWPHDD